ncbi:hypothetical protein M422DRAFT_41196 [Sphaerobolus stellatus SS14]|nr:hypothetical protein M422DRAFT_41196 [Sphaerobolus stellatus SS14]
MDFFQESTIPEDQDFETMLPKDDYVAARLRLLKDNSERDLYNNQIRPLTLSEIQGLRAWLEKLVPAGKQTWTYGETILTRRLKLQQSYQAFLDKNPIFSYDVLYQLPPGNTDLQPANALPFHSAPNEEVLEALYSIKRTPYSSSFASRLLGGTTLPKAQLPVYRDWKTRSLWMDLLTDIKLHYCLLHPGEDEIEDITAPIDYMTLQRWHLPQLNDLLSRIFWPGIDVSDLFQYSPEKCTIIATYKRLVVGAAFLSSPEETYITYVVVRPGWESVNIASTMLYLLIDANPRRDITLHVSASNPAMLLYNKLGFKAEEFVVGFYDDYLPRESKACKNAFRLRLRR